MWDCPWVKCEDKHIYYEHGSKVNICLSNNVNIHSLINISSTEIQFPLSVNDGTTMYLSMLGKKLKLTSNYTKTSGQMNKNKYYKQTVAANANVSLKIPHLLQSVINNQSMIIFSG